jgi:hypothetical protein
MVVLLGLSAFLLAYEAPRREAPEPPPKLAGNIRNSGNFRAVFVIRGKLAET